MTFNSVKQLDLADQAVFLRLDLNVPLKDGQITDATRIEKSIPTIKQVLQQTNKLVIASHLGRPKGKYNRAMSLEPVAKMLAKLLNIEVALVQDYAQAPVDQLLKQLGKNRIILLENLRFHNMESENNKAFAKNLAKGLDYYVNDAFGCMHRDHASIVELAKEFKPQKRSIGFLVEKELQALGALQQSPKTPFTVIVGGAKVSDKIGLLLNLINKCNNLLIGGGMAYTFLAYQGKKIGSSLFEPGMERMLDAIYRTAEAKKVEICLPTDHVCAATLSSDQTQIFEDQIPQDFAGFDVGPKTIAAYKQKISASNSIFWNGPLGVFERKPFAQGTLEIAQSIAESSCFSVAGGGDSIAAINQAQLAAEFSHISTGGGASLMFLEGKTLPGLKVLTGE